MTERLWMDLLSLFPDFTFLKDYVSFYTSCSEYDATLLRKRLIWIKKSNEDFSIFKKQLEVEELSGVASQLLFLSHKSLIQILDFKIKDQNEEVKKILVEILKLDLSLFLPLWFKIDTITLRDFFHNFNRTIYKLKPYLTPSDLLPLEFLKKISKGIGSSNDLDFYKSSILLSCFTFIREVFESKPNLAKATFDWMVKESYFLFPIPQCYKSILIKSLNLLLIDKFKAKQSLLDFIKSLISNHIVSFQICSLQVLEERFNNDYYSSNSIELLNQLIKFVLNKIDFKNYHHDHKLADLEELYLKALIYLCRKEETFESLKSIPTHSLKKKLLIKWSDLASKTFSISNFIHQRNNFNEDLQLLISLERFIDDKIFINQIYQNRFQTFTEIISNIIEPRIFLSDKNIQDFQDFEIYKHVFRNVGDKCSFSKIDCSADLILLNLYASTKESPFSSSILENVKSSIDLCLNPFSVSERKEFYWIDLTLVFRLIEKFKIDNNPIIIAKLLPLVISLYHRQNNYCHNQTLSSLSKSLLDLWSTKEEDLFSKYKNSATSYLKQIFDSKAIALIQASLPTQEWLWNQVWAISKIGATKLALSIGISFFENICWSLDYSHSSNLIKWCSRFTSLSVCDIEHTRRHASHEQYRIPKILKCLRNSERAWNEDGDDGMEFDYHRRIAQLSLYLLSDSAAKTYHPMDRQLAIRATEGCLFILTTSEAMLLPALNETWDLFNHSFVLSLSKEDKLLSLLAFEQTLLEWGWVFLKPRINETFLPNLFEFAFVEKKLDEELLNTIFSILLTLIEEECFARAIPWTFSLACKWERWDVIQMLFDKSQILKNAAYWYAVRQREAVVLEKFLFDNPWNHELFNLKGFDFSDANFLPLEEVLKKVQNSLNSPFRIQTFGGRLEI